MNPATGPGDLTDDGCAVAAVPPAAAAGRGEIVHAAASTTKPCAANSREAGLSFERWCAGNRNWLVAARSG